MESKIKQTFPIKLFFILVFGKRDFIHMESAFVFMCVLIIFNRNTCINFNFSVTPISATQSPGLSRAMCHRRIQGH